jgi:hypothetical protein
MITILQQIYRNNKIIMYNNYKFKIRIGNKSIQIMMIKRAKIHKKL